MKAGFNIEAIRLDLYAFQDEFDRINDSLSMRREDITSVMIEQILCAYRLLNDLLAKDMDLFTPAGLHALLEMNHIVLCGTDPATRSQYYKHLEATRASFLAKIKPIKDWVSKRQKTEDAFRLASGFYTRMLSQPQLFLEGNHRTGNIILNYLLVSKGVTPFVITPRTAREYLDLSGDIKFTSKDNTIESAMVMPGHSRKFVRFLQENCTDKYLYKG